MKDAVFDTCLACSFGSILPFLIRQVNESIDLGLTYAPIGASFNASALRKAGKEARHIRTYMWGETGEHSA